MYFSTTVWSWLGSFIKAENELTGRIGHLSFLNIFTYKPFVYVMVWAITKSEVLRCHRTVSQKTFIHCWPRGSDQAGEQSPLLGIGEPHDSRSLDFLTNPLTLVHVVDEHELDPYVTAVGRLKKREHGASGVVVQHQGHARTQTHKQNTSSLRMISRRGRVASPPPMKVVGGSWKVLSKSDSSRP